MYGEQLREARLRCGLTITEAARQYGCTMSAWSQWEHNKTGMTKDTLRKVAAVVGHDVVDLGVELVPNWDECVD